MDHATLQAVTFWVMVGAFLGGVGTPLVVANKRANEWLLMLVGVGVGAVGSLFLLVPLWLVLMRQPDRVSTGPRWQEDALDLDAIRQTPTEGLTVSEQINALTAQFMENFWPAPRPDGEHSHRAAYVAVFVTLAVVTIIEVVLSLIDAGVITTSALVTLSAAKVTLVVMFFMHLRYDYRWYTWAFASSLPFAVMVMVVLAIAI